MLDLLRFFEDFFNDPKIIDDRMDIFVQDFIGRITNFDITHVYNIMIDSTKIVLNKFQEKKTGKSETTSNRISNTITILNYQSCFVELVRKAEANVRTFYDKKASVYKEIFTKSLSFYDKPALSRIPDYIDHFITRFTAHSELSAELLAKFSELKASFNTARRMQKANKNGVKTLIVATSDERAALNLKMAQNVLQLASDFSGKTKYEKVFFDTNLLFDHPHKSATPSNSAIKINLKSLQTKNTGLKGIEGRTLRVINKSLAKLQIFTVAKFKDVTPGDNSGFIDPEGYITFTMDKLGDPTNKYIKIKNLSATAAQLIFIFLD